MATPLGVRICGQGCGRKTYVSETGLHYSRCLAHTLMLMSGAFGTPATAREETPSASRAVAAASAVAASGSRPRG